MNVPVIITGILVLGGCSGFVKPDYRIDSAVVGQQHAIQNIQVTIKEQNKAHVYNHCVWLNAQCMASLTKKCDASCKMPWTMRWRSTASW